MSESRRYTEGEWREQEALRYREWEAKRHPAPAVEAAPAAPSGQSIQFAGESFEVAEKIGLMPLMRFAHLARAGVDADDMEGLDAMYSLLQQCLTDDAWRRFEDAATRSRAGGDELMAVVKDAIEVMTARPTGQPSDSSAGLQSVSVNSADDSSSPVIARLVAAGRPDMAHIVSMAEASRRSA